MRAMSLGVSGFAHHSHLSVAVRAPVAGAPGAGQERVDYPTVRHTQAEPDPLGERYADCRVFHLLNEPTPVVAGIGLAMVFGVRLEMYGRRAAGGARATLGRPSNHRQADAPGGPRAHR